MSGPIHFSAASLVLLNVILALMMFGVSLTLRTSDFKRVLRQPKAPIVGLFAQFVLLPAASCLATWAFRIDPELALGMILVAACPSGNFSNVMAWLSRANVALSVSISAVSSLGALIMTPLNFTLYGWLNPYTRPLVQHIALSPGNILLLTALVLALPLVVGMVVGTRFPRFVAKAQKPTRLVTVTVLFVFVGVAFANNMDVFLASAHRIFVLVMGQNILALVLGAAAGAVMGLSVADRHAVTLEVGIQNSGLGLALLFTFYPQAAGMILIAAFWGVFQLLVGLALALYWARGARNAAEKGARA